MTSRTIAARNHARIRTIVHTMLDRMERVVAAIARRHTPRVPPAWCPKAACRRSGICRVQDDAAAPACSRVQAVRDEIIRRGKKLHAGSG